MARGRDMRRTILAGLSFGLLLLFSVVALLLSLLRSTPTAPMWGLALIVGTLVALVALLLLEPASESDGADLVISSCAACGKPMLAEWRLCPYCGQMRECDMSMPIQGDRVNV
jgi:peptidoglycan/LPS O-acetylase OafA/YrhL